MIHPDQAPDAPGISAPTVLRSGRKKLLDACFTLAPTRRTMLAAGWALIVLAALFARSMSRFFDLDEHQFTVPSLLLKEGALPYADYPYFHMPTLIYLYAGIMSLTPYKLFAARLVSVLCGWITVLVLFRVGWNLFPTDRKPTRWWIAGGLPLLFVCSRLFTYTNGWAWNHDTAVLCALGAFLLHIRGLRQGSIALIACAGFLVGLAIGIRLSFAFIGLPFALSLGWGRSSLSTSRRRLGLGIALLAASVGLLPALIPMLTHREAFFFGNLEYARLNTVFYSNIASPAMNPSAKVIHGLQTAFTDPGNAVIFLLAVYALGYRIWRVRAWKGAYANELLLLFGLFPVLLIGCWGPTPTQYQYYYMLLPFAVLAILYSMASESPEYREGKTFRWTLIAAVLMIGLIGLPRWYWTIVYLPTPERWVPMEIHRTGEWVRANVPTGARVLTIDPLIPCEAGLKVYPDYAVGRFMMHVGKYMSPEDRRRHRVTWGDELERVLAERPPDAIFVDDRVTGMVKPMIRYAETNAFRRIDSPDQRYHLWVRPQ